MTYGRRHNDNVLLAWIAQNQTKTLKIILAALAVMFFVFTPISHSKESEQKEVELQEQEILAALDRLRRSSKPSEPIKKKK